MTLSETPIDKFCHRFPSPPAPANRPSEAATPELGTLETSFLATAFFAVFWCGLVAPGSSLFICWRVATPLLSALRGDPAARREGGGLRPAGEPHRPRGAPPARGAPARGTRRGSGGGGGTGAGWPAAPARFGAQPATRRSFPCAVASTTLGGRPGAIARRRTQDPADVAQRWSSGFVNRRLGVRISPSAPILNSKSGVLRTKRPF